LKCSELSPENPAVWRELNSVAWKLATSTDDSSRDGKKALEVAKKACALSMQGDWQFLDTLAAAYAETGDFDNAVKCQKKAISMEPSEKIQEKFGLEERLQLYQKLKPFREAPKP